MEAGIAKLGPQSRWGKLGAVSGAVVAVLIIGVASGCGDSSSSSDTPPTTPVPSESVAGVTPPVETIEREPAPPPIGDRDYFVPSQVAYGTYRAPDATDSCYFQVSRDLNNGVNSIITNDSASGPAVVTIARGAKLFSTQGCGDWTRRLTQVSTSRTVIEEGTWIVKVDVAPGTYRSTGSVGCYWERMADFTGGLHSIIANNNTDARAIVRIAPTDRGFKSHGCGTWTRIGG